jgi:hypothetical protein
MYNYSTIIPDFLFKYKLNRLKISNPACTLLGRLSRFILCKFFRDG